MVSRNLQMYREVNVVFSTDMLTMENKVQKEYNREMKEQLQEAKHLLCKIDYMNRGMNDIVSELTQKLDELASKQSKDFGETEKHYDKIKVTKLGLLPPKQFSGRNSLLTELYEIKHIRTIYNFTIAALILLLIRTVVYDIRHTGSPNFAMGTVMSGFGKFPIVLFVWSLMQFSTFGVYIAFCTWASHRLNFTPKSFIEQLWDYVWLCTMILYQVTFVVLSTRAVIHEDLPVASSLIILMEQLRFVMKTYAFVRTVAPRFISYKSHSDTPLPRLPDFSKYLYFLFAPTLIYRDDYPRSSKIRWNVVLGNMAEIVTIIFFVAILYERILEPTFRDFGKQPIELSIVLLGMLESIIPGILLFVCGFYLLLHCWMNAFAELLRFADRMFYRDWWNSNTFSAYYRTWNIVVHDWLHTYIYKDMYEIVVPRNKTVAVSTVFGLSAIFHEYLLCVAFRFFFPVMLLLFGGIGVALFTIKASGNVFVWFSLCLGNGVLCALYNMEHYARINCPPVHDGFLDQLLPRIWACPRQ
ncbi:sterol O-acyltransferase 1 isoform X2 [Calliopsis andreniformis]|uniref:sterol O-acyltransferase 1 isoform X2 n=1 Tax=Calliopsis andreniformis TaxID=337506 RepID=UPI003FCD7504